MRGRGACRGAALALLVATLGALGRAQPAGALSEEPGAAPPVSAPVVPTQFIAKAYTELLGRAPGPAEWRRAVAGFERTGCTTASLEHLGEGLVASPEYRADYLRPFDPAAVTLTLFRFVLNREPDPAGFVAVRDALEAGATPATEMAALFGSTEFATATEPAICNPDDPAYGFGEPGDPTADLAITTPETGPPGAMVPEDVLQYLVLMAGHRPPGQRTVTLPPRAVVGLSTSLTIPDGVTLTTAGSPGPTRYAEMARLVRLPSYTWGPGSIGDQLLTMWPGAHLNHIWVDGQREDPNAPVYANFNVVMLGSDSSLTDDRIGDSDGATNVLDEGGSMVTRREPACSGNVIAGNLIEAYASAHVASSTVPPADHPQTDGISDYCEGARIEDNDLVDITDSGIVLFDGSSDVAHVHPQVSEVLDNTIVSAGNSMSFAVSTDPGFSLDSARTPGGDPADRVTRSFRSGRTVALIEGNTIWTGGRTHIDVVLNEGTHDLFGSVFRQDCLLPNAKGVASCGGGRNAFGALWQDNTSAGIGVTAEMGIYVGGTRDSVFLGNDLMPFVPAAGGGTCPRGLAVVASGHDPATDFARGLEIDVPVVPDRALRSDGCVTPAF